ncbi:MAG: peptidylprolyl isomerase [Kiloniellaceae bacterium]
MRRLVYCTMLCLGLVITANQTARAQDMLRAAAVVNDEVISMLDLDMRMRLTVLSTGLKDSPELRRRIVSQVMRNLIDERLQAQEAERLDIKISDDQVDSAVEQLAGQNKMTRDAFVRYLKKRGVLPEALQDQVRAQLTWRALVARRLRPSVQVSDEEVEEVVERIVASRGTTLRRISEIFLAADNPDREDEVKRNAERLYEQLRAGADFAALAQQFSESATAPRGGDVGWVQDGQLPEEVDRVLATMRPGSLSPPIRTLGGFHIVWLRDQRQSSLGEVTLDLKQILFALPSGATAEQRRAATARAAEVRRRIDGCAGVDDLAKTVGSPGSGDLGTVKLSDLPSAIRDSVKARPIGRPSEPVRVSGGVSILVVCGRTETGIDRQRIKAQLMDERLNMLTRRYMRDLRRRANVDIRI